MTDPRQAPRKGRKDDPNRGHQKEDNDPDLGQKEAEEEKAELEEEGGEKDDELEPMTRTMAVSLRLLF